MFSKNTLFSIFKTTKLFSLFYCQMRFPIFYFGKQKTISKNSYKIGSKATCKLKICHFLSHYKKN